MISRSKAVLQRPEFSLHRALYKSMGYSDYDLERPLIGIANSWNRVVPGHFNLNLVSEYVKQGIFQAGGTPVEFGVMAPAEHPRFEAVPYGNNAWSTGKYYCLPLVSLLDRESENALTLALPPDEPLSHLQVGWSIPAGPVLRLHLGRRALGAGKPTRFTLLFYAHGADYRSSIRALSDAYPRYFRPASIASTR